MKLTITLLAVLLSIGAMAQKEKDVDKLFYDSVDPSELIEEELSQKEIAGKKLKNAGGCFVVGTMLMAGGAITGVAVDLPEVGIGTASAGLLLYIIGGINLIGAGEALREEGEEERKRLRLRKK